MTGPSSYGGLHEQHLSLRRALRRHPRHALGRASRERRSSPSSTDHRDARRTSAWETGKCSGTMYCGDHEHYDFMRRRVRAVRARERAAARHVPERDEVRGRDHRHDARPAPRRRGHRHRARSGLVTTRRHRQHPPRRARLPRARAADARHRPAQLHQARDRRTPRSTRRATCSASSCARRRSTRRRRWSTSTGSRDHIDDEHGRHHRLGLQLRLRHHRPDRGAVGPRARARRRPARRRLPRRVHPPVRPGARLRHPALRLPRARRHDASRPTPTSTATRSRARRCSRSATRRCATASTSSSPTGRGGKYCSPGIEGSRSRRAARRDVGLDGRASAARATCGYAKAIFETVVRDAGRGAVAPRAAHHRRADVLLQLHVATSSTSTTSTTSCGPKGWRFNGQQYPNAIHMAVTRPQTQPGVVEAFADRPRRGRRRTPSSTRTSRRRAARSTAASTAGMTDEADEFIRSVMADMMDDQQALP